MSNPEFKRNLWLSFSTHRIIAMPALLALTFIATALADMDRIASNLYIASIILFGFIVFIWGTRNANASIVDEIRDHTWDQQRMSALGPWTLTWGKLFGATSFNWYGGLMCLAVIAASGISSGKTDIAASILTLCAFGTMLHAALIALNLHLSPINSRLIQRGGIGWLVIVFVAIIVIYLSTGSSKIVGWWGHEFGQAIFWLGSALLFSACATLAAWRVISNALQVKTLPWAWPAFACLLAGYIAGFSPGSSRIQFMALIGLSVSIAMTYFAILTEPNTLPRWEKLRLLFQRQKLRNALEYLPLWPVSLVMCFLFALLLLGVWSVPVKDMQPQYGLSFALMTLRDACILLFFAFAPNSKRAVGATMLYLLVIDILLPFLASVVGLDLVTYFLRPFNTAYAPWSSVFIMALHAGLAIGLVNWRLRGIPKINA